MQDEAIAKYKEVLGHFATGIAVITGRNNHRDYGFTCQAFTALSLDPQLVLFCVSKNSTSFPPIRDAGCCCINILTDEQEAIARTFSLSGGDKFTGLGFKRGLLGMAKLDNALAWIEGKIVETIPKGDHYIVIVEVIYLEVGAGRPLIYYRGGFGGFEP